MTPEQEQRLGRMMLENAQRSGHRNKFPASPKVESGPKPSVTDVMIIEQMIQYINEAGGRVHRGQLIQNVDAGTARIARCLKKMESAGSVTRIMEGHTVYWKIKE